MSELLRSQLEKVIKLTDAEFGEVLTYFTPRRFQKHQYLVQEGNPVQGEFFITKGLVKSFYIDEGGKEHIVQFAMDGHWITDTEAFHRDKPATLNIYCLENCQALSISQKNLERLCGDLPAMGLYFRKKAFDDIALLQRRVLCLIKGTSQERYHDLLTNYPELAKRVPKTMIASYLGVSRETLSRMMLS